MIFLLDTNIYIDFYDRYYSRDIFPTFWDKIHPIIENNVVIPDIVIQESKNNEEFVEWMTSNFKENIIYKKNYVNEWAEVLRFIKKCGYYNEKALVSEKGWAHEDIADPWIIGMAKKEGYIIVTEEIKSKTLNKKNSIKDVKIPDICDFFGIKWINRNEFFREIEFKI